LEIGIKSTVPIADEYRGWYLVQRATSWER